MLFDGPSLKSYFQHWGDCCISESTLFYYTIEPKAWELYTVTQVVDFYNNHKNPLLTALGLSHLRNWVNCEPSVTSPFTTLLRNGVKRPPKIRSILLYVCSCRSPSSVQKQIVYGRNPGRKLETNSQFWPLSSILWSKSVKNDKYIFNICFITSKQSLFQIYFSERIRFRNWLIADQYK